jgi:hypothetical protein
MQPSNGAGYWMIKPWALHSDTCNRCTGRSFGHMCSPLEAIWIQIVVPLIGIVPILVRYRVAFPTAFLPQLQLCHFTVHARPAVTSAVTVTRRFSSRYWCSSRNTSTPRGRRPGWSSAYYRAPVPIWLLQALKVNSMSQYPMITR